MAHNYAFKNEQMLGLDANYALKAPTQASAASNFDGFKIGRAYQFYNAYKNWREETMYSSDLNDVTESEYFAQIVAMGSAALPYIFRELQTEASTIFLAAAAILGRDPIGADRYDTIGEIRQAWITWAHNDYPSPANQQ